MSIILFKDLISQNETDLKNSMLWENYDLNDVVIPVVETLKEHCLTILKKSYGKFNVEDDILEEVENEIFIEFPVLMQKLSITRLMHSETVKEDDKGTETLTRTETIESGTDQTSELNLGSGNKETTTNETQQKTTGTVGVENNNTQTQIQSTEIENTSGIEATGGRNVNLTHSMPEQALTGTGNFPEDSQGTPILQTSYVQSANESFNTNKPINTTETSQREDTNTITGNNDSTTTNNITIDDTGTIVRENQASGKDTSQSNTSTEQSSSITESRERLEANKQYAYEVKALLEAVETVNAFRDWENAFSWVIGII